MSLPGDGYRVNPEPEADEPNQASEDAFKEIIASGQGAANGWVTPAFAVSEIALDSLDSVRADVEPEAGLPFVTVIATRGEPPKPLL